MAEVIKGGNTPVKIGLTGKMRSGKDSIGDYLFYEKGFELPLAFGDSLKYYAHQIFPDVPKEPKPRALYQFMNVMRDFDPDVWVKHLAQKVAMAENDRRTTGIVVTDARQPNEVDWLRENGFIIVKVEAPEAARIKRMQGAGEGVEESALNHRTEQYVDEIETDYVIENDGSLSELHAKVDALLAELTKGER